MTRAQRTTRQRSTGPAKDVTKHFTLTQSSACILHAFENTFACVPCLALPRIVKVPRALGVCSHVLVC